VAVEPGFVTGADLWVAAGSTSNGDQKVWVSRDEGATWAG
jgi:hypothetical protein